jgi:hypothetical protein
LNCQGSIVYIGRITADVRFPRETEKLKNYRKKLPEQYREFFQEDSGG